MDEQLEKHILSHFSINEESGFISRCDRSGGLGSFDKDGYLIFKIKGKQIKSHRLAWFLYYGKWPEKEIDHINRIRTDNSKKNLREADRNLNVKNTYRQPNKITGEYGIYIDKTKGLKKNFTTKIKRKTFRFKTLQEAIIKRQQNGLITKHSK